MPAHEGGKLAFFGWKAYHWFLGLGTSYDGM
jgi:hypothetical protein